MILRVLAFASAAEAIGAAEIEIELADGSGMADLESRLTTDYPELRPLWSRLALAVDGELAGTEADAFLVTWAGGGCTERESCRPEESIGPPRAPVLRLH